jgi:hypothetical protein
MTIAHIGRAATTGPRSGEHNSEVLAGLAISQSPAVGR